MTTFLAATAVLAVLGTIVFFVLLLWAAREDGRDQRRRDEALGKAASAPRGRAGWSARRLRRGRDPRRP